MTMVALRKKCYYYMLEQEKLHHAYYQFSTSADAPSARTKKQNGGVTFWVSVDSERIKNKNRRIRASSAVQQMVPGMPFKIYDN